MKIVSCIFFIFAASTFAQDVQFTATADRTNAVLGERITITAQAVSAKKLSSLQAPKLADCENFSFIGLNQNQSSSTSIQIINGKMTQNVTTTYFFYFTITPKKIGTFTFPSLQLNADGVVYTSEPFSITVGKEAAQAASEVKVSLILSKKNLYVGEQALLTVQVAWKPNAQVQLELGNLINNVDKSMAKDFSLVRLFSQLPNRGVSQVIGGETYAIVKLQYALFPINSGSITIPAIPFDYVVLRRAQQSRRRGNWPFGEFFDDPFFGGGVEQVSKSVVSNSCVVHVNQLPTPPADFFGAVGGFRLNASIDPKEVPAGEAATLSLSITGATRPGNLGDIPLGQLPDCAVFAPEKHVSVDTSAKGIVTHKTYKYLIVPKQEGTLSIPPLSWAYFDPAAQDYKRLRTDTLRLLVTKGSGAPPVQSRYLTQEEIRQVGQDIRYIKTSMKMRQQTGQQYKKPIFILLYLLPLCIALFSLLYKLQSQRYEKDSTLMLRRKAYGNAVRRIAGIRKHAAKLSLDDFLAQQSECLENYITEKFGFSATGKVLGDLRQELVSHGVQDKLAGDIVAFLERMDTYRFGKASLDASAKSTMLETIRRFVGDLDKTRKGKSS